MEDKHFIYEIITLDGYVKPDVQLTLDGATALIAYAVEEDGYASVRVWCDDGGVMRCTVHKKVDADGGRFYYIEPLKCTSKQASDLLVAVFNAIDDINQAA